MSETPGFSPLGNDLFGDPIRQTGRGPLADRFEFPPFSIFDARCGPWQERKRAWLSVGIKSEIGRDCEVFAIGDKAEWDAKRANAVSPGGSARPACDYSKGERGDGSGKAINKRIEPGGGGGPNSCYIRTRPAASAERYGVNSHLPETEQRSLGCFAAFGETTVARAGGSVTGTSIFDPVLCELIYRWFCPAGGQIVDPFAGGSVRGIVTSLLGFKYWGCDLRPGQIAANIDQGQALTPDAMPAWVAGDAIDCVGSAPEADLVFSCPPYGDLEVYSDDPRDLSTMEYHTFMASMKRIILRCAAKLKPNGFACFVVGDFRDKRTGFYRGFVADTIHAFRECGLGLYNDAILATAVGSLPIRVSAQFEKGRKLGKTHQNVLIFRKAGG